MKSRWSIAVAMVVALAGTAAATDIPEFTLVIKNHTYQPSELKVPADTKFRMKDWQVRLL